jgi:hypothetical protein
MHVEEIGYDNVSWIHVVLVQLWALVNTVMNIGSHKFYFVVYLTTIAVGQTAWALSVP